MPLHGFSHTEKKSFGTRYDVAYTDIKFLIIATFQGCILNKLYLH